MTATEVWSEEVRSRLETLGDMRSFPARKAIYARGELGRSMLILRTGRAEISVTTSLGRKSILGLALPGQIIGDIACLDGGPRSADVIALDEVEACVIDRRDILNAMRQDPDLAILVIEALCQKARNASDMFELQSLIDAKARLAGAILRLAGDETEEPVIRVSQGWLGDYAGLSRENVNRQIRVWSDDSILRFEGGALTVLDRDRLEDIALDGESRRV